MDKWKIGLWASVLLLSGCGTLQREPAWVANPKTVYPENQYLVAIGEGDTRQAAENAAAGNLSRIFEAHIESDERLLDQTVETRKKLERTTDFTSDINILSSQTLYNIQHAEAWKDKLGRYHAVAYLDRRETARIYTGKIDEQTTRVDFLRKRAAASDDPLKRYATLRAAVRSANDADYLLRQLKIIHPASVGSATPGYSMNDLRSALAEAAKRILVRIDVEGDRDRRMTTVLEQFITNYGFVVGAPAVLDITGRVAVNDTGERTQDLVFVRYELDLRIRNAAGDVLVTVNNKGREAHRTLDQARTRSFRTLENAIKAGGAQRLDAYFDSLIDQ